ncbi:uncharacterized protein LOC143459820 [Clavelina lepadiformis]|uniref:uncharacterized protein LOC143459820 n=1 Tax=Clavelina lepadiformis TaxID=159417 RepID=UPI0040423B74
MNLSSIPPLLPSSSNPTVAAPKHSTRRFEHVYSSFKITDADELPIVPQSYPDENATIATDYQCLGVKYSKEVKRKVTGCKKLHKNKKCWNENDQLAREMFGNYKKYCKLKKVGSCFVLIRKDDGAGLDDNFDQLAGSQSTLPGTVDNSKNEPSHQKESFSTDQVNTHFWNAKLQLSSIKQTTNFAQYCRHNLTQVRKFITKLQLAIHEEKHYLREIEERKLQNYSPDAHPDSNYEGIGNEDEDSLDPRGTLIRPPKLGKVYAELNTHFKAWIDILRKWQSNKQSLSAQVVNLFLMYQKRIKSLQKQMLYLTEELIQARLISLASCATSQSRLRDADHEWEVVFGVSCLKRFCKLIEAYNKLISQKDNEENNRRESAVRTSTYSLFDSLTSLSSDFNHKSNLLTAQSSLRPFTVPRILSYLAGPVKQDLASSLLKILTLIHKDQQDVEDDYEFENEDKPQKVNWGHAAEIDFDEDQVITHVAGFKVNNISDSTTSNDALTLVKHVLYTQGSFIVSFMNCLAANTSLLRARLKSKSPRSLSPLKYYNDDGSAISSDDDASSIASSSFFSQVSGASGPSSSRRRKTVVWRDSWDHEAVKSFSKSYMASLVTEGPSDTLQSLIFHQQRFHHDGSGTGQHLRAIDRMCCFRPRFWFDSQALTLDASVTNMITLEILPEDILESVHESTQAFIIETALMNWDRSFCQALGVGIKDKCGSLPVEGVLPLSKTAWLYIEAVHSLMFIMDRYDKRESVAREALPRLEATLDAFYRWCQSKIQQFLVSWSLRPLMQVSLGDLSQLTSLSLECLKMVEKCHNHVESRRMENPATLMLATKHLKNIDETITNMQSLSGECMRMYVKKCSYLAITAIDASFPSPKLWKQNNLTDHSCASSYMERAVTSVIRPICSSVSVIDGRSQLAAVPPAVTAILDAVVRYILRKSIRFSVQGAMQLQRDFEHVIDFVCDDATGMCRQVRRAVPFLTSVKRAMWVASTLQRTDALEEGNSGKSGYEASRKKRHSRNAVNTADDLTENPEDGEWDLKERDLLALRMHEKTHKLRGKKWFSLPCSEKAVD